MQRRKKWGRPSKHNCHQFCLALSYKNSVFNIHEMKVQESLFKQSHFLRDLTVRIPGISIYLYMYFKHPSQGQLWNLFGICFYD